MNPNNYPPNIRPTIYQNTNLNYLDETNQYQTPPKNNAMLWNVYKPAKAGYYSLRDPSYPRQITTIEAGASSSSVPFHGMKLYKLESSIF
jgi:hypothetical protein